MRKTLSFLVLLVAGLVLTTPVFAHCGQCGVDGPHGEHPAAAAADDGQKQCPVDCDKPCCADKADKGEL